MYEIGYLVLYLIIDVLVFIWIYYDAKYKAYKEHPIRWAIAGLILPLVIVLYYLYRVPKIK